MDVKGFWRRYKRNRLAVLGLAFVIVIIVIAATAPFLSPYDPFKLGPSFLPPSLENHILGTDDLGRDVFSRILYGAQVLMLVGLLAATCATSIGTVIGAISGYCGGRIDDLLMRITEWVFVIPIFLFALLLVAVFGPSIWNVTIVIGLLMWPATARLVRAEFLSLKEREFVEAVRALGGSRLLIIFGEILPNASPLIIVSATFTVAWAILLETGLSFLGLGDPNVISWGMMLMKAQLYLRSAWWMAVFPGLAISITVLSFNLIGDGLNDALNPRLKER